MSVKTPYRFPSHSISTNKKRISFRDETASTAFVGYFFVTKRAEIFCRNRFRRGKSKNKSRLPHFVGNRVRSLLVPAVL
jgi:hypothetical protein